MVVATFLYSLAGGMLVVLATGRVEQIARGFLRLCGYLILGFAVLATALIVREPDWSVSVGRSMSTLFGGTSALFVMGIILLAPAAALMPRAYRVMCGVSGLAGIAAAGLSGAKHGIDQVGSLATAMMMINQALSAFLLGAITVAWLLGHAYLTATRMTIAPLQHFSRVLSRAVFCRVAFVILSVAIAVITSGNSSALSHLANQWMVGLLRVGFGLLAVGVFAYLVSRCVQLRATQSATGILYFGSIFAYVGELASQHLTAECDWPL